MQHHQPQHSQPEMIQNSNTTFQDTRASSSSRDPHSTTQSSQRPQNTAQSQQRSSQTYPSSRTETAPQTNTPGHRLRYIPSSAQYRPTPPQGPLPQVPEHSYASHTSSSLPTRKAPRAGHLDHLVPSTSPARRPDSGVYQVQKAYHTQRSEGRPRGITNEDIEYGNTVQVARSTSLPHHECFAELEVPDFAPERHGSASKRNAGLWTGIPPPAAYGHPSSSRDTEPHIQLPLTNALAIATLVHEGRRYLPTEGYQGGRQDSVVQPLRISSRSNTAPQTNIWPQPLRLRDPVANVPYTQAARVDSGVTESNSGENASGRISTSIPHSLEIYNHLRTVQPPIDKPHTRTQGQREELDFMTNPPPIAITPPAHDTRIELEAIERSSEVDASDPSSPAKRRPLSIQTTNHAINRELHMAADAAKQPQVQQRPPTPPTPVQRPLTPPSPVPENIIYNPQLFRNSDMSFASGKPAFPLTSASNSVQLGTMALQQGARDMKDATVTATAHFQQAGRLVLRQAGPKLEEVAVNGARKLEGATLSALKDGSQKLVTVAVKVHEHRFAVVNGVQKVEHGALSMMGLRVETGEVVLVR